MSARSASRRLRDQPSSALSVSRVDAAAKERENVPEEAPEVTISSEDRWTTYREYIQKKRDYKREQRKRKLEKEQEQAQFLQQKQIIISNVPLHQDYIDHLRMAIRLVPGQEPQIAVPTNQEPQHDIQYRLVDEEVAANVSSSTQDDEIPPEGDAAFNHRWEVLRQQLISVPEEKRHRYLNLIEGIVSEFLPSQ